MSPYLVALLIFLMRICDVSIGTVRVIYTIRGQRLLSTCLGVVESGIWIFAISRAFKLVDHPASMIGWALGFGAGTFVGITLEKWIATGQILLRVISPEKGCDLRDALLAQGVGVTAVQGEGRNGDVLVLFVVAPRRRGRELLGVVQAIDPEAFITIDAITQAIGGYMPLHGRPTAMRK
ncbi:MAG TPA: DUF5698 domain-containing protein [Tepidisphaeraceae bacterium]|nr:DUF5698 domain-containing protein [Tepidisphaeraceae bacterium]